jgi:hypothetical protein
MTITKVSAIAIALFSSAGCSPRAVPPAAGSADQAATPATRNDARVTEGDMLKVELRVSPARVVEVDDLSIVASVHNAGTDAREVDTLTLPYPSLVLQVRNAAGARVALGPPPVPPSDRAPRRELGPGQALTFEYGNPFGSPPPPGRYEVRLVAPSLESPWVPFEIASP